MNQFGRLVGLALGTAVAGATPGGPSIPEAVALRDAPGGREIGVSLDPGAPIRVEEERDGWLRIRVEGWIPAAVLPGAAPGAVPAAEPAAPAAAPPEAALEGLIRIKRGWGRRMVGEGVPVLLLPGVVAMEALTPPDEPARRAEIARLDRRLVELDEEIVRVMQKPSLMEATREADALEREQAEIEEERGDLLALLHGRHEAAARERMLRSAVADSRGWFRFPDLAEGEYTLYARLAREGVDAEWLQPVELKGPGAARLDLDREGALDLGERR